MQIKVTIGRGSAGDGYWVGERRGARGERRFEREREVTRTSACKAAALALLNNPIMLEYLREYFECDEEWSVFDKEWPQRGVRTAGQMAGIYETIR